MPSDKLTKIEQIEHIKEHIKMVHHEIRRYRRIFYQTDKHELESAAFFALFKASRNYDKSKGLKFTTYLHKCIKNQVLQTVNKSEMDLLSLDKSFGSEETLYFIDTIGDNGGIEQTENRIYLEHLLSFVNDRERNYLIEYYMKQEKQSELAIRDGFSYQNIARIIARAKKKIREQEKNTLSGGKERF